MPLRLVILPVSVSFRVGFVFLNLFRESGELCLVAAARLL